MYGFAPSAISRVSKWPRDGWAGHMPIVRCPEICYVSNKSIGRKEDTRLFAFYGLWHFTCVYTFRIPLIHPPQWRHGGTLDPTPTRVRTCGFGSLEEVGPKYSSSNSLHVPLNPSYATVEHTLVRIISTQFFFLIGTKHTIFFSGNRCMRTGLFFSLLLFRFKDTNKSEKEFSKVESFWHEAEFNNLLFFYSEVI